MNLDGRILIANKTLASWIEMPVTQIVGKNLQDLLTIGTRIFYETNVAPLLALQGEFQEISLELRAVDGTKVPVFANGRVKRDADGLFLSTRVVLLKAGQRRRYERELIDSRDQAASDGAKIKSLEAATQEILRRERETAELREQFIAVLGHDLRNPLAAITSGVDIIGRTQLEDRARRFMPMVQISIDRMAALIDNILDFARGRLGDGLTLTREKCDLEPILRHVVSELQTSQPSRSIITRFALGDLVECDRNRIAQLLSNLLGNALTHGSADSPVVVGATVDQEMFELFVSNSGKPIPEVLLERLFEPFERGAVQSHQQGLGLGLYIASQIAKAHDGTLTATSSPQETRFTFRMPRSSHLLPVG